MVAANHVHILFAVVQRKGEDTVQVFEEVGPLLLVKRKDNLAVGVGLELVLIGVLISNIEVIVDLAINSEHQISVFAVKGLATRLWVYNRQALVGEDRLVVAEDARPIGTTVPYALGHIEHLWA